jgi:flagellar biogenesis protein FliO
MFETIFGADVPLAVRFFLAFLVVLGLIGATAWAVRRFGADRLGSAAARGRQPRLAVVDAASVDSRRRLVIIRRDNVEHLLMIGGPTDVVVETNIVRAVGAQRETHVAAPARAPADTIPRPAAVAEGSMWPLQPEPVARPPRPAPVEDQMHWPAPPEPARAPQRSADALAGLADELSHRPQPARHTPPPPRPLEPTRVPPPQPFPAEVATASAQGDQNLAEMAQRLEQALRRPRQGGEAKPAPAARPAAKQPAAAAEQPAAAPAPQSHAAKASEPAAAGPAASEAKPAGEAAKGGKTIYESLEQEMASLLGRPPQQEKG